MLRSRFPRAALAFAFAAVVALPTISCGGGGSGAGGSSKGGMILLSFEQSGQDNVPLNRIFEFLFSTNVDPSSVYIIDALGKQHGTGAIQIREGSAFGLTVAGVFEVQGSKVFFKPQLPGLCDLSDTGLRPDTQYRVTIAGHPESLSVKALSGAPLDRTSTAEFHTRPDDDPTQQMYEDQIPGKLPEILSSEPANGTAAASVHGDNPATSAYEGNELVIHFTENLDPCSVNPSTVTVQQYAHGDSNVFIPAANGNPSGFDPPEDSAPADPYSWGGNEIQDTPRLIACTLQLFQDYDQTSLVIRPGPGFTEWPDNALIVVDLSFEIRDFGGQPFPSSTIAFTTMNRDAQTACRRIEFLGETPMDTDLSSADVNSARAPGLAQGFLLFSGDGDNGANQLSPSGPDTAVSACTVPLQANDGTKDDFNPGTDVLLNTGSTVNTCPNTVDGSTAVVWEFRNLRITAGRTVRIVGVNPAIIIVQNEVLIDPGGRLLARGDGAGGAPQSRGQNSPGGTVITEATGGIGVAGGGNGGTSPAGNGLGTPRYSGSGFQGYYMSGSSVAGDVGASPGTGGGHGNTSCLWQQQVVCNRNTPGGGGGGHALQGVAGLALGTGNAPCSLDLAVDGVGGLTYGTTNGSMPTPESGSGGGGGGELRPFTGNVGRGPGGGGGAGGGFVDLTAGGDILVYGTIDAAGGAGGAGATQPFNPNYTYEPGTGGGGGGSGGGIRLLTPNEIVLGPATLLTAAGGNGGQGGDCQNFGGGPPLNHGGQGGMGRIVLEDGDSTIAGLPSAQVVPGEGNTGFFRGLFDPTRFEGGGTQPAAVSLPFFAGPASPTYTVPTAADFIAGIPQISAKGQGSTSILVEAQSFPALADGTISSPGTGWFTVGHFTDSGIDTEPNWVAGGNPTDVPVPADNVGVGIANLSGNPWIQFRITFYLPLTMGPLDPGPYVDRWDLCFEYNQ